MKINLIKLRIKGTVGLFAASEIDKERLNKLDMGEHEADIKAGNNSDFHRKVMAFIRFCYNYWKSDREFLCESAQFDHFREGLTVTAGYFDEVYSLDSRVKLIAKSINYASMDDTQKAEYYSAIYNAAIDHIFHGCDRETERKLMEWMPR